MEKDFISYAKRTGNYVFSFFKWVVLSALTGVVGGLVGVAFHTSVEKVTLLREQNPKLIFLLPIGGLVIAGLYKLAKLENAGTDSIIESVRGKDGVPLLLAPLIFVSTVITHFFGGSAGREGAALQLGGSIGSFVGKTFKLDEKDMHLIVLCGMSAVFAALFGTPLTATLFALEVVSVGVIYYSGLVPCLVSSLVAFGISLLCSVEPVRFEISAVSYSAAGLAKASLIAALCALLSIGFCLTMHSFHKGAKKLVKNPFVLAFAGGVAIIALTAVFGTDYNGAGMNIIEKAVISGEANYYDFILKILFTAITIGCGFKGGEIVPTFFIGSTFGCVVGSLIGFDSSFAAAIGLVTLFCSVVNCPVASIFLSIELFGGEGIIYFALACALGYALSGYFGLYSSQKIVYSKVKAQYININTWKNLG